ncbi:caspase family protein [Fibrivirga algicola]|uniref:Caspase family protein n=1 Tax=Fibrivirga algicola TaxID=2950420 RepID=A0ABX0QGY0_9BACT|nr:caspase family protein [Fibrivirga algicola]NID10217.1 caspase family protein [Fibrivirga algicola]
MNALLLVIGSSLVAVSALAQPMASGSTFKSEPTRLNTTGFVAASNAPGVGSRIDWTSTLPADKTVGSPIFLAKACVTAAKPVDRFVLFLNEKQLPTTRDLRVERDPVCPNPFSQSVELAEGENKLRLVAYLTGGGELTAQLVVTYAKSPIAASEKRLALVIGNSAYPTTSKLENPVNDAKDMAATLTDMGFDVMLFTDLDKRKLRKAIEDFGFRLKGYQVGLFFYAGHGIALNGQNYLVPIDASPQSASDIEFDCEPADRIVSKMEDARTTNIIVLDACRNNPFERSMSRGGGDGGLTQMKAPAGTIIAYATSPGKTAADGVGRNGLYTSALLKTLKVPNMPIEKAFKQVRSEVMRQSNGRQQPWESSSLVDEIYFMKK